MVKIWGEQISSFLFVLLTHLCQAHFPLHITTLKTLTLWEGRLNLGVPHKMMLNNSETKRKRTRFRNNVEINL